MSKQRKSSDKADKKPQKAILSKISSIIIAAIFVLVVIAFLSLIVQTIGGKKPSIFGYRLYYVLTDSMEPTLSAKDVLICQLLDDTDEVKQKVKEGDIITFVAEYGAQQGMTITHRVVKGVHFDSNYERYVVLTKGDSEYASVDPAVPIENIQALLVKDTKVFTKMYKFLTSVYGIILVIIIPSAFILAALVVRIIVSAKKPISTENDERAAKIAEIKRKAIEEYHKERERIIAEEAVKEYKRSKGEKDE